MLFSLENKEYENNQSSLLRFQKQDHFSVTSKNCRSVFYPHYSYLCIKHFDMSHWCRPSDSIDFVQRFVSLQSAAPLLTIHIIYSTGHKWTDIKEKSLNWDGQMYRVVNNCTHASNCFNWSHFYISFTYSEVDVPIASTINPFSQLSSKAVLLFA